MKLGKVVVGQLKVPKEGLFNGRNLPKTQYNNELWLKLLALPPPPHDGLYVRRSTLTPEKPAKKPGFLYKIAKSMVDYERSGVKKISSTPKPPKEVNSTPNNIPTSWQSISPDIESELLGLEQLGPNEQLTIIGAGITGLTLAWILSRSRPDIKITIIDPKPEVGGWMQSKFVDGTLFESGPRTLLPSHPGSEIIARILAEIGTRDTLMGAVPRSAPVNAKSLVLNGKIHYLPRNYKETLAFLGWGPLLKGGRLDILKDLWKPSLNKTDESVAEFITRRVGKTVAERMVSGVMRGIYGADYNLLSARSVARLNRMFYLERTEGMSLLGAMFSGSLGYLESYSKEALPQAFDALVPPQHGTVEDRKVANSQSYSLYGFKNGIQSLAKSLADDLKGKVEFKMDTKALNIEKTGALHVTVKTSTGDVKSNVVVSTVADPQLFSQVPSAAEDMQNTKYSSLAVVNVFVPDDSVAKDAFGVLVPKSEDTWNEEGVLGVIFDSSVRKAMVPIGSTSGSNPQSGSCMTVMLGGDLWNDEVTPEEWTLRALTALKKLDILKDEHLPSVITQTKLQRNAIPLYVVGHSQKQQRVHAEISRKFGNRVALVGMAYGRGCGVSDCVVDALTLALRFSEQRQLLYPQYFFDHWWLTTKPEQYA